MDNGRVVNGARGASNEELAGRFPAGLRELAET